MAGAIVRALRVLTIGALPTLLANACAIDTLPMHATANRANLVQALLRLWCCSKLSTRTHAPTWSTRALAHVTHTFAIALLLIFLDESCEPPRAMLPFTNISKVVSFAIALGALSITFSMTRAKSTFATNHPACGFGEGHLTSCCRSSTLATTHVNVATTSSTCRVWCISAISIITRSAGTA